jgi:hypothetical protein
MLVLERDGRDGERESGLVLGKRCWFERRKFESLWRKVGGFLEGVQ